MRMADFGDYIALKNAEPVHFKLSHLEGWGKNTRLERLEFFIGMPFKLCFYVDLDSTDVENLIEQLNLALENLRARPSGKMRRGDVSEG